MHNFHTVLIKGAAVLDCDLRDVQVPPTFQPKIPS